MDRRFAILPIKLPPPVLLSALPHFAQLNYLELTNEVDKLSKDAVHTDKDIPTFVRKMRDIAAEWNMWGYGRQTVQLLGSFCALVIARRWWKNIEKEASDTALRYAPVHMELKLEEAVKLNALLTIIRNNEEHKEFYSALETLLMKLFCKVDVKWQFVKQIYVTNWYEMRPHLGLFLYWQTCIYTNNAATITKYFPEREPDPVFGSPGFDLEFVRLLLDTLQDQVKQGGRTALFAMMGFRTVPDKLLRWQLDGNEAMEIRITDDHVTWNWCDILCGNSAKVRQRRAAKTISGMVLVGSILIGQDKMAVLKSTFSKRRGKLETGTRYLIFKSQELLSIVQGEKEAAPKDTAQELGNYFEEVRKPIKFECLSRSVRKHVVTKRVVDVQGKEFNLETILLNCGPFTRELLQCIEGRFLSELLEETKPKLFPVPKLPNIPEEDDNRLISRRVEFPCSILSFATSSDVFIVLDNYEYEFLCEVDEYTRDEILVAENSFEILNDLQDSDTKIFLLQTGGIDISLGPNLFRGVNDKNVHCFRYAGSGKVEWLCSHGDQFVLEIQKAAFPIEREKMAQERVLESVINGEWKDKKLIIFSGEGEEKSLGILCLARKLLNKFEGHLVFSFKMNEFMKVVAEDSEIFTKSVIMAALKRLLGESKLEKSLVECALANSNSFLKLNIFLDGEDKFNISVESVKCVLTIISKELQSVRLFISLNDTIVDANRKSFETAVILKFEPFPAADTVSQIDFYHSFLNRVQNPGLSELQALARGMQIARQVPQSMNSETGRRVWMALELCRNFEHNQDKPYIQVIRKLVECYIEKYVREETGLRSVQDPLAEAFLEKVERFHTFYAIKLISPFLLDERAVNYLVPVKERTTNFIASLLRIGILKSVEPIKFSDDHFPVYYCIHFASELINQHERNLPKNYRVALLPCLLVVLFALVFYVVLYGLVFKINVDRFSIRIK